MTKEILPLKVDPIRFADNQTVLDGALLIKDMERLKESLASTDGTIDATLTFGVDQQGLRYLKVHLQGTLMLQCQRCLESFNYEIISDFNLGIVQSEEKASELPARYDPLIVEGDELVIQEVIEDELIVSLPIVPMHSPEECKVALPLAAESSEEVERANPFKVIELLREKRDRDK